MPDIHYLVCLTAKIAVSVRRVTRDLGIPGRFLIYLLFVLRWVGAVHMASRNVILSQLAGRHLDEGQFKIVVERVCR